MYSEGKDCGSCPTLAYVRSHVMPLMHVRACGKEGGEDGVGAETWQRGGGRNLATGVENKRSILLSMISEGY
ncbi:hypothetical protein CBR_g36394 [Chara braunii]|uniref:Uncharacterized protein n=1 Tax=Chara braunii TaxID=69332 RepID=A0A388LKL8_CHABU|nr:hypothetical protein CBR_g36394 [Chara braunii]|eukprot:GBG82868.1 hypothetical protein CBR_g36394 [Chara braunii]